MSERSVGSTTGMSCWIGNGGGIDGCGLGKSWRCGQAMRGNG
ncbi:MAG TPA: hypothetical protein VNE61_07705 [Ktedonobacteraceae bacterium]|nr:hypothetical protein [Ktedonobacteraceae bacterium]